MKYKIALFVLIILMIKTNIHAQFYYYKEAKIPLTVNEDRILIRMQTPNDKAAKERFLQKIKADRNFQFEKKRYYTQNREYYLLSRTDGATIDVNTEMDYYKSEPYISSVTPLYYNTDKSSIGISNEVVVKFINDGDIEQVKSLASKYAYLNITQDNYNSKLYHIFLQKNSKLNALEVANELYETGNFSIAVPNFFEQLKIACTTPTPNDPLYNSMTAVEWALPDMNICSAWDLATGSSTATTVAVVDNGVDATHEDLVGRVLPGTDLVPTISTNPEEDFSNLIFDLHGTGMAGLIAANTNNGIDVAGVTLNTKIYPVRAFLFDENDCHSSCSVDLDDSHCADGIAAAASHADVINCSWQVTAHMSGAPLTESAIEDAYTYGRGGKGCIIVAAAGNDAASSLPFPASSPYVLAVSASDKNDNFAATFFTGGSNYGPGEIGSIGVAVAAPGKDIDVLIPMGVSGSLISFTLNPSYPNVNFSTDGTSSSTAYVSGISALLLQINPCLTVQEVYNLLEATADKTGSIPYVSGYNDKMGFGRVNAGNAAILAHDMYRQNETIGGASYSTFQSVHKIYAGYNVTSLKSTGYETIDNGAIAEFDAAESIILVPGFKANSSSVFTASIQAPCNGDQYHWRPANDSGASTNTNSFTSVQNVNSTDPFSTAIYPNPTKGTSYLSYQLPAASTIDIKLINSVGQDLSNLIQPYERNPVSGNYKVTINSDQLAAGIYYCTISISGTAITKKLVVY